MLLSELPPRIKSKPRDHGIPARKIATEVPLDDGDGFNFRLKKHQLAATLSKLLAQLFDLPYDTFSSRGFALLRKSLGKTCEIRWRAFRQKFKQSRPTRALKFLSYFVSLHFFTFTPSSLSGKTLHSRVKSSKECITKVFV